MTLPTHHSAWLSVHPHRTKPWFLAKLKEGFDVHHLDGNHENNDPTNLALVEHTDHMAIHNGGTHILGRLKRKGKQKKAVRKTLYLENIKAGDWLDGWIYACLICDRRFIAKRTSIYCSNTCQMVAHRKRVNAGDAGVGLGRVVG